MYAYENYCVALKQRKIIVILLVLCITMAIFVLFGSFTFAAGTDDVAKFIGDTYMSFFSTNQMTEASDIMLGKATQFYDTSNSIGSTIMTVFKGLGGALLLINAVVLGFKEFSKDRVNLDIYFKIVLKFLIGLVVVLLVDDIVAAIETSGYSIATGIQETMSTAVSYDPSQIKDIEGTTQEEFVLGIWQSMTAISNMLIPCLIIELLNVFVKIVSYGIFFEIVMRRAFMPLALADIFTEGPRSPGMLFLKRYLALYFRMGLVFIVLGCAYAFINASVDINNVNWNDLGYAMANPVGGTIANTGNAFPVIFDAICVMVASCIFINKGANFIEEVFDIN